MLNLRLIKKEKDVKYTKDTKDKKDVTNEKEIKKVKLIEEINTKMDNTISSTYMLRSKENLQDEGKEITARVANNKLRMKDITPSERPYEKLKMGGPEPMTDSELLAIILRTGTKTLRVTEIASMILSGGGIFKLVEMNIADLKQFEGIGEIKAIQIKAVCELAKRFEKVKRKQLLDMSSPEMIANYARCDLKLKEWEVLKVYYLNSNLELSFEEEYTSEDASSVSFPTKAILKHAIANNINSIVLVHNHPSGNLKPSIYDLHATQKIITSLKEMDMQLEDHIIVSDNGFFSMRQENVLKFE